MEFLEVELIMQLEEYQASRGLIVDGLIGCNTWKSLQENVIGTGRTSTTLD